MDVEQPIRSGAATGRIRQNVAAKLFVLLFVSLLFVFSALGYLSIRLHRRDLENSTQVAAERVSDVIKRSTSYYMMRNDREALYHTIETFSNEPGIRRVRIFNREGQISFSTNSGEIATFVDKKAEACYACHAQSQPLVHLNRPDRFRIFELRNERVLGVITPIVNTRTCSEAECHAHPAEQRVLGVLDTTMSLEAADARLNAGSRLLLLYSVFGVLAVSMLSGLFVWHVVHKPVEELHVATERLREGELGYKIEVRSDDQLGQLAASFNEMSSELQDTHQQLTELNRSLEQRIELKTSELQSAHLQMLQAEKLTSLGKMAAVVAHEINNPLSGILTYAKLMRKWLDRGDPIEPHIPEMRESLQLIESESRRCGGIVHDLLNFARATPLNVQPTDVNAIIRQCVKLIDHKMELAGVALRIELDPDLPVIEADPGQIEQLFLALIMNAIEAMPRDGCLHLVSAPADKQGNIRVVVEDNGIGIPEEVRAKLFEPFVSTKQEKSGVGLGLAICQRVVERHKGTIEVNSEVGRGTRFTVTLPVGRKREAAVESLKPAA